MEEQIRQIIRQNLTSDLYFCTRVWEAWQYGTMHQDDFVLANEEEQFIEDFTQAIMKEIKVSPNH